MANFIARNEHFSTTSLDRKMSILSRIFGAKSEISAKPVEHAVIVAFAYIGTTDLDPLFALESQLEAAIATSKVGEYDGNEVAVDGSDGTLYMYGSDADKLFAAVRPILEACSFMKGASAKLRYGPPADGVREVTVQLAA
ncbi:MAG: hypothetical protein REI94_03085 [Moraxellaceae bacterium]|nr:hypothetical protein [Moraxellaceae bacterium]